jgi:hypothetical protein
MREHLGVDVDAMDEDHLMARKPVKPEDEQEKWVPDADENDGYVKEPKTKTAAGAFLGTVVSGIDQGWGNKISPRCQYLSYIQVSMVVQKPLLIPHKRF